MKPNQRIAQLIEERPEVSRGIIRVLTHRLRERMLDLSDMRGRLQGERAL